MNDLRLLFQADKERKIVNLEFKQINNLQIMIPILSKFENLQCLSLNGNRLQSLPNDLSPLEKLNELDISNNLFRDIADVIPSIKTLPRLTHLMYSFKNDEEENLLKKQLPRLQRLNKKPLNNIMLVNKKQKQTSTLMKLSEKDLEEIAIIYDDIREVYKKSKYFVDKELAEEFDKGVDHIMNELSNKLSGASGEEEVNSSIVGCRYALIDLCFVKIITYFYHFDKNIASIIERIHDYIAESFKSMSEILKTALDRSKAEISQIVVKKEQLFKNQIKRLKSIQETHLNEISALQSKNAELLDRITKSSKNNVLETTINNIISKKSHSKSPNKPKNKQNQNDKQVEINIKFNKSLTLNQLKQTINEIYFSKGKHNLICIEAGTPMLLFYSNTNLLFYILLQLTCLSVAFNLVGYIHGDSLNPHVHLPQPEVRPQTHDCRMGHEHSQRNQEVRPRRRRNSRFRQNTPQLVRRIVCGVFQEDKDEHQGSDQEVQRRRQQAYLQSRERGDLADQRLQKGGDRPHNQQNKEGVPQ